MDIYEKNIGIQTVIVTTGILHKANIVRRVQAQGLLLYYIHTKSVANFSFCNCYCQIGVENLSLQIYTKQNEENTQITCFTRMLASAPAKGRVSECN